MGGDFVVFWTAAKLSVSGFTAELYDPTFFEAKLLELGPPRERYGLTWQYPPTYFFAVSILSLLPFGLGYVVWTGGSFAIFTATIRSAGVKGIPLLLVIATPAAFQATITGQNGFLTASLLMGAALYPGKRPAVAGICAALLTMKPQLGILLPIAFIVGGHWRAFAWAAGGSIALGLASVLAFGFAPWIAFLESVGGVSAHMSTGAMPLRKMPTIFAAFKLAGAPEIVALVMHAMGALAAIWATIMIWRRYDNTALRAGVICVGAYFLSPYLFYYELVILIGPITLLAIEARKNGWLPYDKLLLFGLFIVPLFVPGEARQSGFNLGFAVTVMAFMFILHRLRPSISTPQATPTAQTA